ncbi:MAG: CBS domain-containing protein [Ignavibacteria bacterium]|nr:CBS domain-containing protein [Ignavibacteria bacterium]
MKTAKEIIGDRKVFAVQKDLTVLQTAKYMTENKVGLVPILDGEKLIGVFSERDLMQRVVVLGKNPSTTPITEVMTTDLIIANVNETYLECFHKMKKAGTRHILIIENDKLVGVLSIRDILQVDLNVKEETLEVLHNYIYSKPKLEGES